MGNCLDKVSLPGRQPQQYDERLRRFVAEEAGLDVEDVLLRMRSIGINQLDDLEYSTERDLQEAGIKLIQSRRILKVQ